MSYHLQGLGTLSNGGGYDGRRAQETELDEKTRDYYFHEQSKAICIIHRMSNSPELINVISRSHSPNIAFYCHNG